MNYLEFISYVIVAFGTVIGITAALASFLFRFFLLPHINRMGELEKTLSTLVERLGRLELTLDLLNKAVYKRNADS